MKNIVLFSVSLLVLSCGYDNKPVVLNSKIDIAAYIMHSDTLNYESKYDMHISLKSSYGDTIKFIYYNEGLTDHIDTLTICNPDSLVLGNRLKLLAEKDVSFNGKRVSVKKYWQSVDPMGPFGNVYINDSLGLILTRHLSHPHNEHVIMYNTAHFSELHKEITRDSVFFKGYYE